MTARFVAVWLVLTQAVFAFGLYRVADHPEYDRPPASLEFVVANDSELAEVIRALEARITALEVTLANTINP